MKPKKPKGQSQQTSSKNTETNGRPRNFRAKRITVIAAVASILLILTISVLAWQSSVNQPSNGQQAKIETPKAAIIDGIFSESPNLVLSQSLTEYLSAAGFKVDNYRGENVTIDLLCNIKGYSVIILRLHSTLDLTKNLFIFSGEPYDAAKYLLIPPSVRVANTTEGKMYFAINIFLLGANKADSLKDSTIILMGCNGTSDDYSINRLFERGVKTYFGWTGFVDLSHTDQATLSLVKALYLEKLSPTQAVEKTMTEVGPDPEYNTVFECRLPQQ